MWIVILAVVGAVALWMIGGKQVEYSTALRIDASPEVVFLYLTEPDHLKDWVSGLSEVEALEPNAGVNGDPRRRKTSRVATINGERTHFEDEVLRYEQDQVLSVKSTSATLILTWIFQLEPRESQTHLSYRVKKANSGLGRFIAPMRKDSIQSQIDEDIRRLKALIETKQSEQIPDDDSHEFWVRLTIDEEQVRLG